MRKLFFAICFINFALFSADVFAAAKTVSDIEAVQVKKGNPITLAKEVEREKQKFRQMSKNEMNDYLKERLKNVVATELGGDEGLNGDGSISIEKSPEMIAVEEATKKSTFEKIYDNAMGRIISPQDHPRTAPIYQYHPSQADIQAQRSALEQEQQDAWIRANIDVIDISLPPNGEKTLAPAKEHIPYMFSRIELLPDGLIQVTDTITAVANGEKLKKGITRAFPKYVTTRLNEPQKIDFNLLYVMVNDQPVEYKTLERGNYIFIEPKKDAILPNGVYNYEFSYLIDNHIFQYDEFDEFYWNLTGNIWNLVIARAGATIILPPNTQTLGQMALSGYPGAWRDDDVSITKESDNAWGFVSINPLFVGQGLQMIVSIPKGAISNLTLTKRFLRFINANGDIVFSIFGFLAIAISYFLSWQYIRRNKNAKIANLTKDAPILRYLAKGAIDNKSFGAFLLDLYRKNIIDIEENDGNVLLIKKTDNLKNLSRDERKAVNNLFTNSESVLNINSYSMLKVKRAFENITQSIRRRINMLSLKLNSGYILFSVGMLLLAELGIAALGYDLIYNFTFMLSCTFAYAVLLFVLRHTFQKAWLAYLCKGVAVILLALTWFILCSIVHPLTSAIILLIVYTIIEYSKLYAQRGGLLGTSVMAATDYQKLLARKVDDITVGRDFLMHQAAIFAVDNENLYQPNDNIKSFYKLDIISNLVKKI